MQDENSGVSMVEMNCQYTERLEAAKEECDERSQAKEKELSAVSKTCKQSQRKERQLEMEIKDVQIRLPATERDTHRLRTTVHLLARR